MTWGVLHYRSRSGEAVIAKNSISKLSFRWHSSIVRSLLHIQKSFILRPVKLKVVIPIAVIAPIACLRISCYLGWVTIISNKKERRFYSLGFSAFSSYFCLCLFTCRSKSFFTTFLGHLLIVYISIIYINMHI